jgi:phosphopantothenoylcysteine decarboxylase / phosphopantothenate---cysteine ligase
MALPPVGRRGFMRFGARAGARMWRAGAASSRRALLSPFIAGRPHRPPVHPVANIRGTASTYLADRRIVLGICGSIAAVKCVELARELIRHGADVVAVMSDAATRIVGPDAVEFGTGNPVVTRLTGQVEHVALLGDVPGKADLLLIAPATANTVSKMALGIDDSPVTTCATVAFGTKTPIVVAPAMHEAMLDHPTIGRHARTLLELGVTWVEPKHEEKKAKLAEIETIVEAVMHRLANGPRPGPLAGKKALVVNGATAEPADAVRVLTNRASGLSGHLLALELSRLGADVTLWDGHVTDPLPSWLADKTQRFSDHASLMTLAESAGSYDQVWMPAAINDYAPVASAEKIESEATWQLEMRPLTKVVEVLRKRIPDAVLVPFKAEADDRRLERKARERLQRYGAQFIVGNTAAAFGASKTEAILYGADGSEKRYKGSKAEVMRAIAQAVAGAA